jgi:hypothetical protein
MVTRRHAGKFPSALHSDQLLVGPSRSRRIFLWAFVLEGAGTFCSWTGSALAQSLESGRSEKSGLLIDRAVVRFTAPEGGGRARPYFIYERELSFEARLAALADAAHRSKKVPFRRHHLQGALERHIAETLLAALPMDPEPSEKMLLEQLNAARTMIVEQVGGEEAFFAAARKEGLGRLEQSRYFRRRARASLYLHVMVTPMLQPSALELRRAHRSGEGPLASLPYAEAEPALRRWYVARSLKAAVTTYFQNARARVQLQFL